MTSLSIHCSVKCDAEGRPEVAGRRRVTDGVASLAATVHLIEYLDEALHVMCDLKRGQDDRESQSAGFAITS